MQLNIRVAAALGVCAWVLLTRVLQANIEGHRGMVALGALIPVVLAWGGFAWWQRQVGLRAVARIRRDNQPLARLHLEGHTVTWTSVMASIALILGGGRPLEGGKGRGPAEVIVLPDAVLVSPFGFLGQAPFWHLRREGSDLPPPADYEGRVVVESLLFDTTFVRLGYTSTKRRMSVLIEDLTPEQVRAFVDAVGTGEHQEHARMLHAEPSPKEEAPA